MDPVNELPDGIARALKALDARAARREAAVDPERVVQRVLARLRSEPAAPVGLPGLASWVWGVPRTLRVAAAAVLLVLAGATGLVMVRGGRAPAGAGVATLPVVVQVDSLSQAQAEAVLKAIDDVRAVNGGTPAASTVSVQDLSEQELRALLQAMQSSEGAL
jgi:hypothetical protein